MKTYSTFAYAYYLFIAVSLSLTACSKSDGIGDDDTGGSLNNLSGTIYYDWATEGILRFTMPSGSGGAFIPDNRKLNNFDVSRDGAERLTVVNESTLGVYPIRFTISNMSDNATLENFVYNSPGLNAFCKGYLSHDKSLIMITSNDEDDGITILRRNGEFVTRLIDINGEEFDFNETRLWLPNNGILLTHKNFIIRLDPPYTSGKLVKDMAYDDWGDLAVNPAGTQLLVRIGNHLHTMDMNGSEPVKITESNFKEAESVFSPDGKHILVGSDYRQTGPFGYVWNMKIIPNDGKVYNVDPVVANSSGVIPVIWRDGKIEAAGGQVIWR
ncbi:hypothetical protein M8998_03180 [Sphingobacterium sp. lm-10]|uniref:hypothetical protein n=1 Tax=Sphingobacterium sp. lm-10 TaxID=2944904 RepID=UPI002021C3C5|nr:hypothetical protein [Sphingobacterium sp. lm-10]MCL7986939.1 hypothetical protein [Sphingobacterium sp. lm-10]